MNINQLTSIACSMGIDPDEFNKKETLGIYIDNVPINQTCQFNPKRVTTYVINCFRMARLSR